MPVLTAKTHPTDLHVGVRLRLRRKELALTQAGMAHALGVTFQQVQKYERGANRVSASKLFDAAQVLGVPIGYFFDGLPQPISDGKAAPSDALLDFAKLSDGPQIISIFSQLGANLRRKLTELARALVEPDAP